MGYKPNEIEQLQPQEVTEVIQGAELADERMNRRIAYFTTWLIAPHVKKGKVSMDKIMKPLLPKQEVSKADRDIIKRLMKDG